MIHEGSFQDLLYSSDGFDFSPVESIVNKNSGIFNRWRNNFSSGMRKRRYYIPPELGKLPQWTWNDPRKNDLTRNLNTLGNTPSSSSTSNTTTTPQFLAPTANTRMWPVAPAMQAPSSSSLGTFPLAPPSTLPLSVPSSSQKPAAQGSKVSIQEVSAVSNRKIFDQFKNGSKDLAEFAQLGRMLVVRTAEGNSFVLSADDPTQTTRNQIEKKFNNGPISLPVMGEWTSILKNPDFKFDQIFNTNGAVYFCKGKGQIKVDNNGKTTSSTRDLFGPGTGRWSVALDENDKIK